MPKQEGKKPIKNNVKLYREDELGWTAQHLADKSDLSVKTISRIEKQESGHTFRATTYTKVLNAINKGFEEAGRERISREDLYPPS